MNNHFPRTNKIGGFTLIEFMVAMLISFILIAAVFTVYLSNKKTYRLSTGMNQAHDTGRFVTSFLQSDFRMAGWIDTDVETNQGFSLTQPVKELVNNAAIKNGQESDKITIRYFAAQACDGAAAIDGIIENQYALAATAELPELQCNGIALASNVESFQILYGVQTAKGIEYLDSTAITDVSMLRVIQFSFSVASNNKFITSQSNVKVKKMLGQGPYQYTDGRYRQVFTSTVVINNRGTPPPENLLVSE